MSRTRRETSVDVNVVLIMNKSCFLYLCFSVFSDDFGGFFLSGSNYSSVTFVSVICCQKMSITPGGAQPSDAGAVVFASVMLNPSGTGFLSECPHSHLAQFRLLVWHLFTRGGSRC